MESERVRADDIICKLFSRRPHIIDRKRTIALPCANSVCVGCVEKALFKMAAKTSPSTEAGSSERAERKIAFLCPICKAIHCNDAKSLTLNGLNVDRLFAEHLPTLGRQLDERLRNSMLSLEKRVNESRACVENYFENAKFDLILRNESLKSELDQIKNRMLSVVDKRRDAALCQLKDGLDFPVKQSDLSSIKQIEAPLLRSLRLVSFKTSCLDYKLQALTHEHLVGQCNRVLANLKEKMVAETSVEVIELDNLNLKMPANLCFFEKRKLWLITDWTCSSSTFFVFNEKFQFLHTVCLSAETEPLQGPSSLRHIFGKRGDISGICCSADKIFICDNYANQVIVLDGDLKIQDRLVLRFDAAKSLSAESAYSIDCCLHGNFLYVIKLSIPVVFVFDSRTNQLVSRLDLFRLAEKPMSNKAGKKKLAKTAIDRCYINIQVNSYGIFLLEDWKYLNVFDFSGCLVGEMELSNGLNHDDEYEPTLSKRMCLVNEYLILICEDGSLICYDTSSLWSRGPMSKEPLHFPIVFKRNLSILANKLPLTLKCQDDCLYISLALNNYLIAIRL